MNGPVYIGTYESSVSFYPHCGYIPRDPIRYFRNLYTTAVCAYSLLASLTNVMELLYIRITKPTVDAGTMPDCPLSRRNKENKISAAACSNNANVFRPNGVVPLGSIFTTAWTTLYTLASALSARRGARGLINGCAPFGWGRTAQSTLFIPLYFVNCIRARSTDFPCRPLLLNALLAASCYTDYSTNVEPVGASSLRSGNCLQWTNPRDSPVATTLPDT